MGGGNEAHGRPAEGARYWRHPGLPDVDLLRARYVTHRFGRHMHDGYVLAVIEDGVEEFDHDGSLLRAGPGAIVLVNPATVTTGHAGVPEGWAYRTMYPAVEVVSGVAAEIGGRRGTPHFPDAVARDAVSARMLRAAHRAAEHGDQLAASSVLRMALAAVLRRNAAPVPVDVRTCGSRPAVRIARDLLAGRLTDPPSLDELAARTGMNPFALLRAFRADTGLPPHAYLNQLRVGSARRLLDRSVPLAEVAARTGFADQAHLTRHFKRVVGVPPGAYQRERGGLRPDGAW